MLSIPIIGFPNPQSRRNLDPLVLCDWLEANLLFGDEDVTEGNVIDVLQDNGVCDSQAEAERIAGIGWDQMAWRNSRGYHNKVTLERRFVSLDGGWAQNVAFAFMVALSTLRMYKLKPDEWSSYADQGDLFEELVEILFEEVFPSWEVYRAGWSPDNPTTIFGIIDDLAERMSYAKHPNLDDWVREHTKDGGLDIVCYRTFGDDREALPSFFVQCASGANWRSKIATPNASAWAKWLDAAFAPSTAIAAPFVIEKKDMTLAGLEGQIVVLDRLRLLTRWIESGRELPRETERRLSTWLEGFERVIKRDYLSNAA